MKMLRPNILLDSIVGDCYIISFAPQVGRSLRLFLLALNTQRKA